MKKIKKIWQENSVLFVLFFILVACLVAICIVVGIYFIGDSKTKYGDRLEDIAKYPFEDELSNNIVSKLKEDQAILNVDIRTSGKTIYIKLEFDPKTSLVEAQSKALAGVELFGEKILSYYDLEFLINAEATNETEGFHLIGARNVSGTGGIVWNNNTALKEE